MRRWRRLMPVVLCVLMAADVRLQGTTIVPVDLRELTRSAGAIVRGRVSDTNVQWTADRRSIETVVTLETEATLKGSLSAPVRFSVPGGTLGRYRRILVGAPELVVGDRVVVFLAVSGPTMPYLVGFGQGVFRVQADSSRALVVTPPPLAPSPTGAVAVVRGDPVRRPVPLQEFERQIRQFTGTTR
jgi:hypothetical protein